MKHDLFDEALVREYLLGRLENNKELEERVSHEICVNDDLLEMVESIEEEIIEDFLDGSLDPADKDAVDGYFLRPPERKEKLRFARLLRNHLEQKQDFVNTQKVMLGVTKVRPESLDDRSPHFGQFHLRNYGGLAAIALLTVAGLFYISGIRKNRTRLEAELAQERQRSATVAKVEQVSQASMVALTLVSDRSRGDGTQIPNIEITPSAQRIVVEIALTGSSRGPFDVVLQTKGKNQPIWTARLLPLISASGDARLVFDIPAKGIASDVYSFVVSSSLPRSGGPKHYDFRITVAE